MEKLQKRNIEVYRTDESGTVIVTQDSIVFISDADDYLSGTELLEKVGGKP